MNGEPHADPNQPSLRLCEVVKMYAIDPQRVSNENRCPKGPIEIAYTTVLDPEHRRCLRHENELADEQEAQREHQKWLDQDLVDQIQFSAQAQAEKEKKKVARLSGILLPKPKAAVSPVLVQGEFAKAESSAASQSRETARTSAGGPTDQSLLGHDDLHGTYLSDLGSALSTSEGSEARSEGRHVTWAGARVHQEHSSDTSGMPSPDMSL